MRINECIPFIACQQCGASMNQKGAVLICSSCKAEASLIDEKIYFTGKPDNIEINTKGSDYEKWSAWRKANYNFFERELKELTADAKLVDIGAGPSQFRKLFERFSVCLGVDYYPYDLVHVVTDITKPLPLKDASFNGIILSNTLEHVPNVEACLKECFRIAKPKAKILITIPFLMRIHQAPYDFNRYTHYQLERMVKNAGFHDVEVKALGTPRDVYEKMQHHFFTELLHSRLAKNTSAHYFLYVLAKLVWWIQKATMVLFTSLLYKRAAVSMKYTEGYAVTAIK